MSAAHGEHPPTRPRLTLTSAGHFVSLDIPARALAPPPTQDDARISSGASSAASTPEEVYWLKSSRVSLDGVTKLRDASTLLPGGINGAGCGGGHCGC
jgi:hypothetical protein